MRFQAALVKEQNVTFAVVSVRRGIINNHTEAAQTQAAIAPAFNFVPVILMEQDHRGVPTYFGRDDIVQFLANIDFRRLPWKSWDLN
jgi:hypothetical protein